MNIQLDFITYGLIICVLLFGLGWFYCFKTKVFSWIDLIWSASFIVMIGLFHFLQKQSMAVTSIRIIDILYLIWATRLSLHLYTRISAHGEDKRYVELKNSWKVWYGLKFFILFQVEAILTVILAIPLMLTYSSDYSIVTVFSVILFSLAIFGETISDLQLKRFIKERKSPSLVCNVGLWKYSRHPNYFFEWLIWVSFALLGLTSNEKWPALLPPLIMYFLLTKVTGVPVAEKSSLASKKENYIKYQKTTSAFFPWFSKQTTLFCFLLISLLFFNNNYVHATGVNMQQQEKIKHVFTTLRADNIEILNDFYAADTTFIDPLGTHKGLQSVKDYYSNLYKNVKEITFKYNDIVSSGNTHVLVWTMILKADGLNNGKPVNLEGTSHIKFNDNGLVIYHRDYFDMGEFIYEHIPVLGWTVNFVKDKLREKK